MILGYKKETKTVTNTVRFPPVKIKLRLIATTPPSPSPSQSTASSSATSYLIGVAVFAVYLKSVVLYQFVSEGGSYLVIGFANVRLGETPFNDQLLHNEFIMSQHVEHERSYNSVPPMGSFDLNLLVPKGLDSQI